MLAFQTRRPSHRTTIVDLHLRARRRNCMALNERTSEAIGRPTGSELFEARDVGSNEDVRTICFIGTSDLRKELQGSLRTRE